MNMTHEWTKSSAKQVGYKWSFLFLSTKQNTETNKTNKQDQTLQHHQIHYSPKINQQQKDTDPGESLIQSEISSLINHL